MYKLDSVDQKIKDILTNMDIFDAYRLVDVNTYEVFDYQKGSFIKNQDYCYSFWHHQKPCENCISRSAIASQCQMFKLEFSAEGQIFLVVSFPVIIDGRNLALELMKDVTTNLVIKETSDNSKMIEELIESMNESVIRDSFTHLYNKNYTVQEIERGLALNKHLHIAMMDLDHFKNINDIYGHIKGDEAILYLAKVLNQYSNYENVMTSRVGGDEFMIVFENMQDDEVRTICTNVINTFCQHSFSKLGEEYHVGISLGLADSNDYHDLLSLIDVADQEMYKDKQRKRASQ